jgi:transposase InsO family protein
MPLKVMDIVEMRLQVLLEPDRTGASVRAVCARHGIDPDTFYAWRARYRGEGLAGLQPRSRRPASSRVQTPTEVEDAIVALAKQFGWGPRKIRHRLLLDGIAAPATSTVAQVLIRRGVRPAPRRRAPRDEGRRFTRSHSNELWQIDGTCHRLGDGTAFWVADIVDDHARYLLAAQVGATLTGQLAWTAFRTAVAEAGLPAQLLSDNGLEFTGRLHGTVVSFERQVHAAGVRFGHSRPHNPRCAGKIERLHQTENAWIAAHRPDTLTEAQTVLDAFRRHYNTVRPHDSLNGQTPAMVYRPGTPLLLPDRELLPADTNPPGCQRRKVDPRGRIRYADRTWQLAQRWAGVTVGVFRDGATLHVYYGHSEIDTLIIGTDLTHPNR